MHQISSAQVQGTNDACTLSKCSTVYKKYYKDDFVEEFVGKKKTRASLIHLGYYTRAVIFNKLINEYIEFLKSQNIIKFQIISCGSGFDTLFWRLAQDGNLNDSAYVIEIDFPDVIHKKLFMINQSIKLKSYLQNEYNLLGGGDIYQIASKPFYFLFGINLCDIDRVQNKLMEIGADFSAPTLFLSECAVTYMKREESDRLINWMAVKFENGVFINYEQIHPSDGFGVIMMRHFNKFQSSLYSVSHYPTIESHLRRYKCQGFQTSFAMSEMDLYLNLFSKNEFLNALCLEMFDEFEELFLKCAHYVIAVAGNGISSSWIKTSFLFKQNSINLSILKCEFLWEKIESKLNIYRHRTCSTGKSIYVFGGCNYNARSKLIYKLNVKSRFQDIETVECEGISNTNLDAVHGAVTFFELNKKPYICLYGGRTAPDKICNEGAAVVFELANNKLLQKLKTSINNPTPRYRTSTASLSIDESTVKCYVFGGRTHNLQVLLGDLWELAVTSGEKCDLQYEWKEVKCEGTKPDGRFSCSLVASPSEKALYLSGGVNTVSLTVYSDVWKWCQKSRTWTWLTESLLPRFGHTSHIIDDKLYLIGGVNLFDGKQPGIAVMNLKTFACVEYSLEELNIYPILLFNHSSEIIEDENGQSIAVIGGGGSCFSFGTYINEDIIIIKTETL